MKQIKKQAGFTIIEVVMVIGILVIAVPSILSLITESNNNQQAHEIADQTKAYDKAFIDSIKYNYAAYYDYAVKNPETTQVIKFSDLKKQGFISNNIQTKFNIIPCVAMKYNATSREMQSIMFFTDDSSHHPLNLTRSLAAKTAIILGGEAGYYDKDKIIGNSWALNNPDDYVSSQTAGSCDTSTLTQNSIVVNLNMLENYPKITDTNTWLSRAKDSSTTAGTLDNANTMQTDIIMQSAESKSGILLSGSSINSADTIFLGSSQSASGGSIIDAIKGKDKTKLYNPKYSDVLLTGSVQTGSVMATQEVAPFTKCDDAEASKIVRQSSLGSDPITSQLQCTKNILQCTGQDPSGKTLNGYCYLPIQDLSIRYHPNTPTYTCKVGYVDPTVPATATSNNANKPAAYGSYCRRCDWIHCWDTWEAQACDWKPDSSTINNIGPKTAGGYTIYTGVEAHTNWIVNQTAGGDCGACGTGGTKTTTGIVSSVTCTTSNPVIDAN